MDKPSNAIEWAMAEMINQPRVLGKAVEEIDSGWKGETGPGIRLSAAKLC